jgi:hypothetical protein
MKMLASPAVRWAASFRVEVYDLTAPGRQAIFHQAADQDGA